jgi:glutamate racemase
MASQKAIGVFDSGVGGLTVLNAIRKQLPCENLVYLGDTARVPYGTKSAVSVQRYAAQATKALLKHDVKMIVIACNTASAYAIEHLQAQFPDIPIVGVIEPGAIASCKASQTGRIGVIATEGTVNNQAYHRAILELNPEAMVSALPCSLFVALAEEGWHEGSLVESIVAECLKPITATLENPLYESLDTLVLGCTHFPVLKGAIKNVLGQSVTLVDSALTTAQWVERLLNERALSRGHEEAGSLRFFVTDGPDRFRRVAGSFFSESIDGCSVELIDIQHID